MKNKVLIVDDEPLILEAVSSLLSRAGYVIRTCHMWPGVAAEMRNTEPDVVLLDYNMPGVNGADLCQILKRNQCGNDVKIVLFSAEEEQHLIRIVRECGADGYIKKNAAPHDLISSIEALTSGSTLQPADVE